MSEKPSGGGFKIFNRPSIFGTAKRRDVSHAKAKEEERKQLFTEGKCYVCKQEGHKFYDCPNWKRIDTSANKGRDARKGDKRADAIGKKNRPSAGLVPDIIGDAKDEKRTELCRAWGKVSDEHCLFFFDDGAKANFISHELVTKLGIRPEEMGSACEAIWLTLSFQRQSLQSLASYESLWR